jgi:26S proteasome regulatory subunit N1
MARSAELLVVACAWAGTGNVLKIQQMLQICSEHVVDFSAKKKEEVPEEEEVSEETEEVSTPGPEPELTFPTPIPPPLTPGFTPTGPAGQGMEIDQPTQPETPGVPPTPAAAPTPNSAPAFVSEEEERKLKEAKQEKEFRKQGIAVIGIALVAMGEEVGAEMALRHFQHLVRLLPSFLSSLPFLT